MSPLCTVIIVAYASNETLPEVFRALAAQSFTQFEVIVVDNGTDVDAVRPGLAPPDALILRPAMNLGFAAANNLAARHAKAPLLALLNPDAFPQPDWLARLVDATARHPTAASFGSFQTWASDQSVCDGAGDAMHVVGIPYRGGFRRRLSRRPGEGEIFSACGAAMLVRRKVFEEVGGFDESFFCFCEDVDLGYRLRLAGYSAIHVPDAVVRHVGGASAGERSAFADRLGARNRIWTFLKNTPDILLWPALPAAIIVTLALLISYPLTGRGFAGWRGVGEAFAGVGPLWRKRREVQQARRASVFEIARMLSWSPLTLVTRSPIVRRLTKAARRDPT